MFTLLPLVGHQPVFICVCVFLFLFFVGGVGLLCMSVCTAVLCLEFRTPLPPNSSYLPISLLRGKHHSKYDCSNSIMHCFNILFYTCFSVALHHLVLLNLPFQKRPTLPPPPTKQHLLNEWLFASSFTSTQHHTNNKERASIGYWYKSMFLIGLLASFSVMGGISHSWCGCQQ